MKKVSSFLSTTPLIWCLLLLVVRDSHAAFGTPRTTTSFPSSARIISQPKSTTTALHAIGVLARKAKEAELRQYVQKDISEDVLAKMKEMKANLESPPLPPKRLQESLTKRKGTITIVTEYKRKLSVESGFINDETFTPDGMSPIFREFGASAVAVMADERMGGCTYEDLEAFVKEQKDSKGEVPGPLPIINSDLIVDEIQIARSAAVGSDAIMLIYGVVDGGKEKVEFLIQCATAVGLEVIVQVADPVEAQGAVDAGARIIYVVGISDDATTANDDEDGDVGSRNDANVQEKLNVVKDLNIPEGENVCTIANVLANNNQQLEEVEEAWICRDKGFNAVWVSDALYKSGNDPTEHAGAIIKSMAAKSSVKWASAKAKSGKGEGAKEYLGDLMM